MKKVAITTLISENIGNRLQNYALQNFLEKLGYDVYTLDYRKKRTFILFIKDTIKCILGFLGIEKFKISLWNFIRKKKFQCFSSRYIKFGDKVNINCPKNCLNNKYDYFVTGSDQVWHNWQYSEGELEYFYLEFVDAEKRVSYAPSFGFSEFLDEDLLKHQKGLMGINKLSCREVEGCKLIEELTGQKAERVIDPTFLLSKNEWTSIEKKPKWFKSREYIITYFLGNIVDEYDKYICKLATKYNLEVINIFSKNNKDEYIVTPDEFVFLINNAKFVCTDSFHACAFSIIFDKKFVAFPRKEDGMEDMKGRIETLFEIMNIEDRWYNSVLIENELNGEVNKIIEDEKKNALKFIKNALN